MKRITALLLIIAMLCIMMAGCGKKEEPQSYQQGPVVPIFVGPAAPVESDVDTFDVYTRLPDSWGNPYCWAWSTIEGDAFSAWPGAPMNYTSDGWYTCEVPEWVTYVIISGLGGSVQTADIPIESRTVWIAVNEDGSTVYDYEKFEPEGSGYTAVLNGQWESVHLNDGSFSLNVRAMVFPETVYNCTELTVNMEVQMNAGTSCKDWQLWGRCGGSFVKLEEIYLPAGNGAVTQIVRFVTPVTFDALVVTPTVPGGYSWTQAMSITDVWTES